LLKLNAIILSLLMYSGTVGYDGSMMNGLQSLHQWQTFMNHPTGAWLGFINAIQAVGGLLTYPIQAYVADRYGRKPCLYLGLVFVILGAALQTAAQDHGMFIAARFFIGVATSWFSAAAILITEMAYPSHRAKVTALYNCQFYVGSLIAAWVTFGVRNLDNSWAWRTPSLLQLGIPVLAFFGTITSPESPRWLISHGRNEEARAILATHHAGGDANAALVIFEMSEIEKSIALERQFKEKAGYLDMFKTKGNRHRLFITVTLGVFGQWDGK
jgi:MFS family permease